MLGASGGSGFFFLIIIAFAFFWFFLLSLGHPVSQRADFMGEHQPDQVTARLPVYGDPSGAGRDLLKIPSLDRRVRRCRSCLR